MCELGEDVDIAERSVPLIAEELASNRKFADYFQLTTLQHRLRHIGRTDPFEGF